MASRSENPDAFIVYKPHPEDVAGLMAQGLDECQAGLYSDAELGNVAMSELLD
jgi:capsular polysaccharide export protein